MMTGDFHWNLMRTWDVGQLSAYPKFSGAMKSVFISEAHCFRMKTKKCPEAGPRSAGLVSGTIGCDSLPEPLLLLRHGGLGKLLHQFYVNGLCVTQSTNAIK